MASIKAAVKRGMLQYVYDGVQLGTLANDLGLQGLPGTGVINDLEDGLMWFQRFIGADIQSGKTVTGSSGIGHSVHFNIFNVAHGYSPEELFATVQELREIYNDAVVTIQAMPNPPVISDPNVLAVMMADDRLQTVSRTATDYTTMRLPWVRTN